MTGGYKGLQQVTRGCSVLQRVTGGYKGLQKTCFFKQNVSTYFLLVYLGKK